MLGGGQEEQLPFCPLTRGAGRVRIALHMELFPSLLCCRGTFYGIVDRLVEENFSGGQAPDPNLP